MQDRPVWDSQIVNGAVAGLMATVPMTLAMLLMHRRLGVARFQSLAPKKVTLKLSRKVGLSKFAGRKEHNALSTIAHFGYGAACGAVYAPLSGDSSSSPLLKGALFGFAVWAASYRGWLPAINIWRPKLESSSRRTIMILAHLVWGASTGLFVDRLQRRS